MVPSRVNNFTVIESDYGKFIVNRYCEHQAEYLIKTGRPHIEPEIRNLLALATLLPKDCVIVDAGANIGLVSIPLAHAVKDRGGVVYAFEVQRMMFNALCGAAALNDLENLICFINGLGSTYAMMPVSGPDYGKPQDFGQYSLLDQEKSSNYVDVVSIDGFGFPRLDLLKIDVEGMDIDVIRGAKDTIRKWRPFVWVEHFKVGIPAIEAEFNGMDYQFREMDGMNVLCYPTGASVTFTS